jgi:hypothetical protein
MNPPPHTTPQRTWALTTVAAAGAVAVAVAVAVAGTVGTGCITSHDSIIISEPHITPQWAHATGTVGAECIASHDSINTHRR